MRHRRRDCARRGAARPRHHLLPQTAPIRSSRPAPTIIGSRATGWSTCSGSRTAASATGIVGCARASGPWSAPRVAAFTTRSNPLDNDPVTQGVADEGLANTNVVWHGNRLLALEEGHAPVEVDPATLDTIGPWRFDDQLLGPMTAHPKLDPKTGEMLFFRIHGGRHVQPGT